MIRSIETIYGDLFDVLPTRDPEAFDACVTDGPYGIGFMGKEWDSFAPGREAARIVENRAKDSDNPNLKGRKRGPASSPSAVEYDRSLAGQRGFQDFCADWGREVLRVLKPGAHLISCGAPRSYHRMAAGLEDAGFEVRDCFAWLFGQGFPKSLNLPGGLGTALKPAYEPIILARKPLRGTVAGNMTQFGTGALNIEACRVGTSKDVPASESRSDGSSGIYGQGIGPGSGKGSGFDADVGRWPPNVLLTHSPGCDGECLPDCPVLALDQQSGPAGGSGQASGPTFAGGGSGPADFNTRGLNRTEPAPFYGDSGGASRFYPVFSWDPVVDVPFLYCPKPSRAERDAGCEHLVGRQRDESRDPEAPGANNPRNRGGQLRGNFHPTVKPIALMRWLLKLVVPPGGRVVEPFLGSGTTACAAVDLGIDLTGIEREAPYLQIARARIAAVAPLFAEEIA